MRGVKLILISLMYVGSGFSHAESHLRLSSYDMPPYIGEHLNQHGALYELVEAVFTQANRRFDVDFLPISRAINSASRGEYSAVFPVNYDSVMNGDFLISSAIASYQVGLLGPSDRNDALFPFAKETTIAVLRGSMSKRAQKAFAPATFVYVSRNVQAMSMLQAGRVDYVLIERFTAGDLMMEMFPHMLGKFTFSDKISQPIYLYVAFSKKFKQAQEEVRLFDTALSHLRAHGVIGTIMNRHGL